MPRNISDALRAKMRSDSFSLATIVTITRRDGVVLAFTSWDVPFTYNGLTFQPTASLQSNSVTQTANSGTDNLDVQGIIDSVLIKDSDLINGKYDGAFVLLQEIDPTDTSSGTVTLMNGYSGELTISEGIYVGEVRSKAQKMVQQFGDICSGSCRVNQLGDSDCAPGGVFANGATMLNYRQNGTVNATGIAVASTPVTLIKAINCGGGAVGSFVADTGSSGGTTESYAATVNTSYQNSAPASVYQTTRRANPVGGQAYGANFSYVIGGMTYGQTYTVRLHWAENYFPTSAQIAAAAPSIITGAGMRLFNVLINDNLLLLSYDVYALSGGKNIAVNKELLATADSSGNITVQFTGVLDNAIICGIEVLTLPTTGVTNGIAFTSTPNQPSGVFNYGKVTFTSGLNTGLSREVKVHYLNGTITQIGLQEKFPYAIGIGDAATLEWGCDRLANTCRNTFHNLVNIQAEPYVPGNDQLIAVGRPPS